MAVTSSTGRTKDLQIQTSSDRTKILIQPPNKNNTQRKVPVVYYLSKNGQLDHPHFMEVPLSSQGLLLRDVINRLNFLRGKGMATMYSWSSKRSYKNGFVWHDLAENDFIYPSHGQEYVLKGSELFDTTLISKPDETVSSSCTKQHTDNQKSVRRRRNQSWSSIEIYNKSATNASTQTQTQTNNVNLERGQMEQEEEHNNERTELSKDEISPPPSDSSTETLESLMRADGGLLRLGNDHPSGRLKASSLLRHFISCGSMSFRECGEGRVTRGSEFKFNQGVEETSKDDYPTVNISSLQHGSLSSKQ